VFAERLQRAWYARQPALLASLLRPLAWLFGAAAALRRAAYRRGVLPSVRLPVPVIVVGNVTAGGAGKTPLVCAIVEMLRDHGRHPAIVSRGYGRRTGDTRGVDAHADARDVGDEPLILAATGVPVWVGTKRPDAVRAVLAAHPDVDVVVADDGLQHYALARDIEIAVVDGEHGLGNGLLLPAGPLREPAARLGTVDAVVRLEAPDALAGSAASAVASDGKTKARGVASGDRTFAMAYEARAWRNVADPRMTFDPRALPDPRSVAIAGIAHPQRFFDLLRARGFCGRTVAFPDHHAYTRADLRFADAQAILMTEKDAVKCRAFADERMWMLPILARVDAALFDLILERLRGLQAARDARLSGHQGPAHP
jgi:tetraacyldisaccharide 4'-kinase